MGAETSTVSGQKVSRTSATATCTTPSSRTTTAILCGMVAILSAVMTWADDDVVGPLRDSITAASVIVEGEAGRPYASWDGADPESIRTYTPFMVTRVLKGAQPLAPILLRQTGGDVAGASTVMRGAEFSEGEQAIVFLGARDAGDGSYDVSGGRRGKFLVQRDDSGRPVLDVRLGADASAYGRAEKAPGTGLARVPVELFEQLAAGARIESVADFERTHAGARNSSSSGERNEPQQPASPMTPRGGASNLRILAALAVLAALFAVARLMRRRDRSRYGSTSRQ